MLSIGGTQEVPLENFQDPWTNGLGIFDMTTLSWTNAYDAAAPAYERPSLVSQFYANNSRYPIAWADPELQRIFTTLNGVANVSSESSSSRSSGNSSNSNSNNSTDNNDTGTVTSGAVKGVIGSVIGGIPALAIIGSLVYRRLRQYYKRKEKQVTSMPPKVHELPI
jgi:hypothetical protein